MELTWIAIAASLLMGASALLIFIWAVRYHQFRNFEDVKYQVFWSDLAERKEPEEAEAKPVSMAEFLELTKDTPAEARKEQMIPPRSPSQL